MGKRKTREEYINELKNKALNMELIGDYIDYNTKTLHYCMKHDVYWDTTPGHILSGKGCWECGKEKRRAKRRKSEEQYIAELAIKNPTIKLKGKYQTTNTAVEHYCEIHNFLFNIRPADALRGKGCKYCKSDKIKVAISKTEDEYVTELAIKNPTVRLTGPYLGYDISTEHYCLLHNITWKARPGNILNGKGCWQCRSEKIGDKLRKPEDVYVKELYIKNTDIEFAGEYIDSKTPVRHYCKKHEIYFNITPISALRGAGCHKCGSERLSISQRKSEEQYIMELQEKHPNIILDAEYVGGHVNTPHKCLVCGCEWSPRPSNLLTGYGCPGCNQSKGEKQVETWLQNHEIIFVPQYKFDDCCDKKPLPFDFYLPDYNLCIEYQGQQHYDAIEYFGGEKSLKYTQHHDKIKKNYCINNNIQLIYIPYWENTEDYLNQNLLI